MTRLLALLLLLLARDAPALDMVAWAKDTAVPISTTDPESDADDLKPLVQLVGNARIVSLGEATHGTREIFQMKHRILKALVEERGFTAFGIEANMPEAAAVNTYVLEGLGDPKEAIAGMYFWTWNTEEVLALVEWMRDHNTHAERKVEFWGFDSLFPHAAADSVVAYLSRVDSPYLEFIASLYSEILTGFPDLGPGEMELAKEIEKARIAIRRLDSDRAGYVRSSSSEEFEWALQCARVVVQAIQIKGKQSTRDRLMAQNVEWILDTRKHENIVLWAHNYHVSLKARHVKSMGEYLQETYGEEQKVIGFGIHSGDFTARGPKGITSYAAAAPPAESYEFLFHQTGMPAFLLDLEPLRSARDGTIDNNHETLVFRSVGAVPGDAQFFPAKIENQFDILIFLDKTTASRRLTTPRPKPGEHGYFTD